MPGSAEHALGRCQSAVEGYYVTPGRSIALTCFDDHGIGCKYQAGFAASLWIVSDVQPVGSTICVSVWRGLRGADGLVESTSGIILIPLDSARSCVLQMAWAPL
jgi:hypothetical protein